MEFNEFRDLMQDHMKKMFQTNSKLFTTSVDKEEMWNLYLDSFPPGTNEIYREKREYDCSCCKQFIRNFGNVVILKNNRPISIWDFDPEDSKYTPVVKALSKFMKSAQIKDVFVTKENQFGSRVSFEDLNPGVKEWDHFFVKLPKKYVLRSSDSVPSVMGDYREVKNVFKRSLEELAQDSIETVLELIYQKSLYKGEEWKHQLEKFLSHRIEYSKLPHWALDNYCWAKSIEVGPALAKIKNHSIGVLLTDISEGMDLNEAVKRYEKIVAPTNYKRPKAIFTKKMIEDAKNKLAEEGLLDSLERRHARIDDVTVNNILFANKDTHRQIGGDVFSALEKDVSVKPKKFDKVEEVSIDTFINDILPKSETIELLLENKHSSNLMSIIAPTNKNAKTLFKWDNNFSWAYSGNITDSMKERVKSAGGNIEGVLRFSIQWNEDDDNLNDYDAHCIEPNKNRIWFNQKRGHKSGGNLDVDIISPKGVAVENITWPNIRYMQNGKYQFLVHNYTHRGGRSGFSAEIEYDGQIYSFDYKKDIKQNEYVLVAELEFNKETGIKFIKSLDSQMSSRTVWGLQTNQFQPVSVVMYSPNYWDDQKGIGHRHFVFIMNNCKNDERPNGFFNEFLHEDLMKHKKVFEALGSKMKVENSDEQLSGLGFSATKRNSVVCKIKGSFTRTIKINF